MAAKIDLRSIARVFAVMASLFFITQLAFGQSKPDVAKQQQIKTLIEALVSRNKPLFSAEAEIEIRELIPAEYDRVAQRKVLDAWNALLKEGIEAFPALIANVKDERHSCSYIQPNYEGTLTVGEVCNVILTSQVAVYLDVIEGPNYFGWVDTHDNLGKWWRNHKHKGLRAIQIEAAEWALQSLKKQSSEEMRHRKQTTGKPLRRDIGKLEAFLDRLKKSDRPLQPKYIEGPWIHMIGLPGDCYTPHLYQSERGSASTGQSQNPAAADQPGRCLWAIRHAR